MHFPLETTVAAGKEMIGGKCVMSFWTVRGMVVSVAIPAEILLIRIIQAEKSKIIHPIPLMCEAPNWSQKIDKILPFILNIIVKTLPVSNFISFNYLYFLIFMFRFSASGLDY